MLDMLSVDYYSRSCNHSITSIFPSPGGLTMPDTARRVPTWLAIVAASLPMFMATLDNLVITNALPAIRLDLDASIEELQWFVNAFTLAFAAFILAAAALGDRIGR